MPTKSAILDALSEVLDPDLRQDIVSLGFVTGLEVRDGQVELELEPESSDEAARDRLRREAGEHVRTVAGVRDVTVRLSGPKARPAITLTPKALAALGETGLQDGDFLRIGVTAGGCSGLTYAAFIDDEMEPDDLLLREEGGLRIVTDPESAPFLDGLKVDYSDDLIRSGFRFTNPNAGGSCGCGASFKADS